MYFPDSSSQRDLCCYILPLTVTHAERNGCSKATTCCLPRQTRSLNALIQCNNLVQWVSEPQLLARGNRTVNAHGAAVKGTWLCEVYWLSTSHLLRRSHDARICELANSAFLPCWHNVSTQPSGRSYDHLLVAGPTLKPRSFEAVAPEHHSFTL